MTIAEFKRAIDSKNRVLRKEAQDRASYDYILADLIGRSVSRIYASSNKMPELGEVYPSLFDTKELQEKKKEKMAAVSALRFRLFAEAHNKKFKGVQNPNE